MITEYNTPIIHYTLTLNDKFCHMWSDKTNRQKTAKNLGKFNGKNLPNLKKVVDIKFWLFPARMPGSGHFSS